MGSNSTRKTTRGVCLSSIAKQPLKVPRKPRDVVRFGQAKVYVASIPMDRGGTGNVLNGMPLHLRDKANKWVLRLNATSCQSKRMYNRWVFSPLTVVQGSSMDECVEVAWQKSKRYSVGDVGPTWMEDEQKWWEANWDKFEKAPRRCGMLTRYKKQNGRYPWEQGYVDPTSGAWIDGKVEARKQIYCKLYRRLVVEGRGKKRVQEYRDALAQGMDIVVSDLDGPKMVCEKTGKTVCQCLEVTPELLEERIKGRASYGHGYVLAAAIAGIECPH